ncbi:MAG: class I SAM-dependent methyltransferase [Pseudomonadales bacterium]|nr:class I SAM-dependent methyltransferase [Pseudomonadales bacterium]
MINHLEQAFDKRALFLAQMQQQQTDCYRLFHGSVEGIMGLTIDRYASNLLIQSFHTPISPQTLIDIYTFYFQHKPEIKNVFYHNRAKGTKQSRQCIVGDAKSTVITENGIRYFSDMRHAGQDPLLFLDFRHARRLIKSISQHKTVLNTFSFSCGIGIAAASAGASKVVNVDFAISALDAGKKSLLENQLDTEKTQFIHEDYFLAIRQMAGLSIPVRQKRGIKGLKQYPKQDFDIVVLDPPRWAKSKFGTVDLVRDYNSVFKPALLTTRPGGQLFCTNNVAQVDQQQWIDGISRCCEKNKRPITDLKLISVDEDFPTFDDNHPLKQALITFA